MREWATTPLGSVLLVVATMVVFMAGWLLVTPLLGGSIDSSTVFLGAGVGLVFGIAEVMSLRKK